MNIVIPAMNLPERLRRRGMARARIGYGQIFSRQLEASEVLNLRLVSGHLWVTLEGSRKDHLMVAGDAKSFAGPGRLVAEGIEDGAVVELGEDQ